MKKVALIFTGGTISMMVDERLKAAIPALSDKDIISKVSGIEKMAQIEVIHYGAYPGPHIVPNMMLDIARVTNELLSRDDIAGVVITHGTDTLEETAYFLDLVIDSGKPVVVTGSMRNGSELGYDGPANLAASICTVCSEESKNKGVLVVMNNQVNAADEVTKTHTLSLDTFQSMDFGPLGIVDSDQVIYYRNRKNAFKIVTKKIENRVALIKAVAGLGSEFIDYLVDNDYKGIVIEALGRGNLPPTMLEGIRRAILMNIPVVIVSRCSKGRVLDSYGYQGGGRQLRDMGVILGDNLSGQKARIKLMIVLGVTKDVGEVRQIFEKDLYKKI
ncbi:asparaginase [Vallitalea sp.]|jgi:L-asparaginase|uniref:asparaginase n=1 Tax=Vallitalea sp. TaxID=1882829 RepID=UPI0025DFFFD2|nr:asparaginase [Vallitalea sp.]MCT4688082.1 asparaginase [Vallitalea sp.]